METLGEKIRRVRKQKGLNQSQVAEIAGITQSALASIENNKTNNLFLAVAKGIARALDVSFNDLFEIESGNQELEKMRGEISVLQDQVKSLNEWLADKNTIIDSLRKEIGGLK